MWAFHFAVLLLMLSCCGAQRIPGSRQRLRVRIRATADSIVLQFVRPTADMRLQGYILGYGGGNMIDKQFILLPEEGHTYQTEVDAEPKYLVAVQPIPSIHEEKQCTGKVDLDEPLHLVVQGSVSPTAVLLSWGKSLKTPPEGDMLDDCLEDGFYTIRYRERNRKWNYQTCPTSDTVIDNLKPNTPYEFTVRANRDDRKAGRDDRTAGPDDRTAGRNDGTAGRDDGTTGRNDRTTGLDDRTAGRNDRTSAGRDDRMAGRWSNAVLHNTNMAEKGLPKPYKVRNPLAKPLNPVGPRALFPPRPALHNRTRLSPQFKTLGFPGSSRTSFGSPRSSVNKRRPNLVGKLGELDKLNRLKLTDKLSVLNPHFSAVTAKPDRRQRKTTTTTKTKTTTTTAPLENVTPFEHWEESEKFSSQPNSDVDAMGKKRFVAPHVMYKTDKGPDEPCSITSSLNYFPGDETAEADVTAPPRTPPSNVTVVTVEGCPSFIILDWEKSDNGTREYEVVSTAKGPDGEQVSVLTTNQTHTAVENLKPDNSYEFKVTPKNDLGTGPPSDPVTFSTESADPRVSENVSGKDAIWTAFPFQTDGQSECRGGQYVKRTWYRKFVGVQICNSLRYKIYLSDTLTGKFYSIGDQSGFGEDHCQFVDSFLDGKTGRQLRADQLPPTKGFYRAVRQQPVTFGQIGGQSHISYVSWYECGTPIPGKW